MIRQALLILYVFLLGMPFVWAGDFVAVANSDHRGNGAATGVVLDVENRLVMVAVPESVWGNTGGKLEVCNARGKYGARVIAGDVLYGLYVIQVDSAEGLAACSAMTLADNVALLGTAVSIDSSNFCIEKKESVCSQSASVLSQVHPAQNVYLHKGFQEFKQGAVLLNSDNRVVSLWQEDGWIPLSVLRRLWDTAKEHIRAGTRDLGSGVCLAGMTLKSVRTHEADQLLGQQTYTAPTVLMVEKMRDELVTPLQLGDIILSVEEQRIDGSLTKLVDALRNVDTQEVRCSIVRFGRLMEISVPVTRLKESWGPYFVIKDLILVAANQRISQRYNIPEGTVIVDGLPCFGRREARRMRHANGAPVTYEQLELLAQKSAGQCPVQPCSFEVVAFDAQQCSLLKEYAPFPWFVRRMVVNI